MGMRNTFQKAAMTGFKVAGDVVESATYILTTDDGFGEVETSEKSCKIIYDTFTSHDLTQLGWEALFRKTDKKGLVPALSIDVEISNKGKIRGTDGKTYAIVEKSIDPAGALYILLLRSI